MLINDGASSPLDFYFINIQRGLIPFYLIAMVAAISIFSYMFKRESTDFFHSLGVRREKLLSMNYVTGLIVILVPYVIGYSVFMLGCAKLLVEIPIENFMVMLIFAGLASMIRIALVYTTVVLCTVYASNIVSTVMVFFTITILPWLSLISVRLFVDRFLLGFPSDTISSIDFKAVNGTFTAGEAMAISLVHVVMLLVIYLLTVRAYKKRKSESTMMIHSPWIRNLLVFLLTFSVMVFTMFMLDSLTIGFGILGAGIVFLGINAILEGELRKAFMPKKLICFAGFTAVMLLMIIVMWSGLLGNNELPEALEVEAVHVTDTYGQLNVAYSPAPEDNLLMEPETIQAVLDMNEAIIEEAAYPVASSSNSENKVQITYYMTDGTEETFMYNLDDIPVEVMSATLSMEECKENMFFFMDGGTVDRVNAQYSAQTMVKVDYPGGEPTQAETEAVQILFADSTIVSGLMEAIYTDIMNDTAIPVRCSFDYKSTEGVPEEVANVIRVSGTYHGEQFYMEFVIEDTYTNTLTYIDQVLEENLGYGLVGY